MFLRKTLSPNWTSTKGLSIDAKSYRMLYKLNENTKISVKTSESKIASIRDSVGQGSFAATLVSSLNIGCAITDKAQLI